MQARTAPARVLRRVIPAAAAALAILACRRVIAQVASLVSIAAALCFLAYSLARRYESRLSRSAAALAGLVTLAAALLGVLGLSLPPLAGEMRALSRTLPGALDALGDWLTRFSVWTARRFPGIPFPALDPKSLLPAMPDLAVNTLSAASGVAGAAGRFSLAVVLAFFLLRDRDAIALRLELFLPAKYRAMGIGMALAAGRELRLYLWAQLRIALAVGGTAAGFLLLLRLRSALLLGLLVGIMNMIPYFGPIIGGVPAVLIALADGPARAALTLLALCLVQQLDGAVISPRIMGAATGLSPAAALLALFAGAELSGGIGMVLAIPVLIVSRTLFRVYVQRAENI